MLWNRRFFWRRYALAAAMLLMLIGSGSPDSARPVPTNDPVTVATPKPATKPRRRLLRPLDPIPLPTDLHVPTYRPGPPPFKSGETLVYDASWLGVPAAEARISVDYSKVDPRMWTGQMWITTSRGADLLYRMRDYFRENFTRESLQPDNIYILQHEKQRRDEWRVAFDHKAQLVTTVKTNSHGRTWIKHFSGGEPRGPFSGAMMALSQPLKTGETYTYDVFSGGNRYVFQFKVMAREQITTTLGTYDTIRIEPSVLWLSEGSFRSQARETTIWVTNDSRHLPVRIACAVFFGNVTADLVQVVNGPSTAGVKPLAAATGTQTANR
jgi:Protein of unknown function (DUF3108)